MPTYDYRCDACGHEFEQFQSITASTLRKCPECGKLKLKRLIGTGEMVGKIKAATDARHSADTLLVARTDAIAVEGVDAALERARRYADAGADLLFVEAPRSADEMARVVDALGGRAPLLANMVEGGRTPMRTAAELESIGYAIVIFPGGLVRAVAHAARAYFESLRASGTNRPLADRMLDLGGLNELLGTDEVLARGRRYDAARFDDEDA